jgi:hypothetical protein
MINGAHSFYGFAMGELCVVGCCVDFLVGCQSKIELMLLKYQGLHKCDAS